MHEDDDDDDTFRNRVPFQNIYYISPAYAMKNYITTCLTKVLINYIH